ncbi:hypothetical protein EVAR_97557_1 [Eumeta japonica]|uniref:Uncharacterized protein n=1 Tax=Eumeta variegata TaxID=151549 RepID=A0A4C1WS72_EUMVA|nr:hypothetical protein EVAR_97557_1 [Eumeta japonica]
MEPRREALCKQVECLSPRPLCRLHCSTVRAVLIVCSDLRNNLMGKQVERYIRKTHDIEGQRRTEAVGASAGKRCIIMSRSHLGGRTSELAARGPRRRLIPEGDREWMRWMSK